MSVGVIAASYVDAVAGGASSYSAAVLADTPKAYWRLGDPASSTTAVDASGNANTGTYLTTVVREQPGLLPGDADMCADFTDTQVTIPPTGLQVDYFTIEALIRPDNVTANRTVVCHDDSGQDSAISWRLRIVNPGRVQLLYKPSTAALVVLQGSVPIAVGTTYHVAGTFDGTTLRIYVNGVQDVAQTVTASVTAKPTSSVRIGALAGNQEPFDGRIDEVTFYDRALTAARVKDHYLAGLSTYAREVVTDSPLAYYRLGEASGTAMLDASGNARHGTYSGVALGAAKVVASSDDTAASFDGAAYGDVPEAAWMKPTAAITYEAWVRPTSVAAGNRFIIGRSNLQGLSDANYQAYLFQRGGLGFTLTVNTPGGVTDLNSPDTTLVVGQTYHVVGTYDGSQVRLYVNGALAASTPKTGALSSGGTNPLRVGSVNYGSLRFVGSIDEAAMYGAALSAARVKDHYLAGLNAYAREVVTDSPLAYYRLNEASGTTFVDVSGNSRPGALVGAPTLQAPGLVASDPADKAVDFNGTSQYGDVPYGAWMQPAAWTVEALIKPDKVTRAGGGIPILARHHSTQYQYWMLMLSGGKLVFEGRIGTSGTLAVTVTGTTTLTVGVTYHVAATFDGTNVRIYLNGVLEATGSADAAGSPPTIDLAIGALTDGYSIGNGWAFDGVLDEVAFYGAALSAARIAAHRQAAIAV